MISEAPQRLQFSKFLETVDTSRFSDLFQHIAELQTLFKNINETTESIKSTWESCQNEMHEFIEVVLFKNKFSNISERFQYFNVFLEQIAPVLRDLTRSHRESNWKLHLSAVRRALPLCFAFDRVNYKRWLSLYYEDCLALPQNFPKIYEAFLEGDFTVKHTTKSGNGVPMDQALEKEYNKPAKGTTLSKESNVKQTSAEEKKYGIKECEFAKIRIFNIDIFEILRRFAISACAIPDIKLKYAFFTSTICIIFWM